MEFTYPHPLGIGKIQGFTGNLQGHPLGYGKKLLELGSSFYYYSLIFNTSFTYILWVKIFKTTLSNTIPIGHPALLNT